MGRYQAMIVVPAGVSPYSREKLLQVARTLPADLQILSALGEMLQDVNSELGDIAGLLRRDVALASRIVRISNSAIFGGAGQVGSVEDAVNRVGFGEILKLVGTATAARFTERALDSYDISAVALRDNMLYVAIAAEVLARAAGMDVRTAYTAGLLRPLGLMVLDRASRGQLNFARTYSPARWESYSSWEGSVFGIDHGEVAAFILQEWRFPPELCGAIRAQNLAHASDYERPLAVLVNLANGLAHRARRGLAGEQLGAEPTARKLAAAGVSASDLDDAPEQIGPAFEAAIAALSA
jgi:HD-like signal output (HDOD) protein